MSEKCRPKGGEKNSGGRRTQGGKRRYGAYPLSRRRRPKKNIIGEREKRRREREGEGGRKRKKKKGRKG